MMAKDPLRIVCNAHCGFMDCPRRATLAEVLAEALDHMEGKPGLMVHDFSEDCADWRDPDQGEPVHHRAATADVGISNHA